MKKIISYLKNFFRQDFDIRLYLTVAIFLSLAITFNYYYDFEDSVIDSYFGQEIRFLWYFLWFGFAWYSTAFLWIGFNQEWYLLRDRRFWLYSVCGIGILAFDSGFHYHYPFTEEYIAYPMRTWVYKCFSNFRSVLTLFLPLYLFYRFLDRQTESFYGFTRNNVAWKPYAWMLLIMAPLIFLASLQPAFLKSYPSYPPSQAASYLNLPEWVTVCIFELAYGLDFVATELSFRGFLIIGMAGIMGRGAVLPMVTTYAFLHFGKPLGETISSIFGGYILGVIALYSRNIWGGVAIHLGVAWLMELAAFFQKTLRLP